MPIFSFSPSRSYLENLTIDDKFINKPVPVFIHQTMGYVTRIVSPWGEFHPWVEFAPVSGQTYLSVYMFNRGEISPLPLCL